MPSLPFLDHRHYGGCLLAPCRLHISLLFSLRHVGARVLRSGPLPRPQGGSLKPAAACPQMRAGTRFAPWGAQPGRWPGESGLAPRGRVLRRGREVSPPSAGAFHYYRLPRCGSPSRSIIATTFPCVR